MMLSTKTKESIKTALAMTIAYGIALQMDWDRPYWAGFAVAMVSLATIGQSLNKAALRMFGTLVGVVVALILVALFPQERWAFILFLSLWGGLCAYLMGGSKHAYFWQVGFFVCVVVAADAGPDAVNAFETAVLRAQETGLGILVYSLVSIFLWPSSSRADFDTVAGKLASSQHQLYRAYLALLNGQGSAQDIQSAKAQEIQLKTRFDQLLDAAKRDSYEVWELRRQWQDYQRQVAELAMIMERWHEGFTELQTLDLRRLLPNLDAFRDELDARLAQIAQLLTGAPRAQVPQAMDLPIDKDALRSLSHFHKAGFTVTRSYMLDLERLTRSLFETVGAIRGFGKAVVPADEIRPAATVFLPDLDRLANSVRLMAIVWLAWLAVIYVDGLPGGSGVVSMAGAIGIAIATMPQLAVWQLVVPVASSVLFAGVVYIFVMPKLSSFLGLGLLIFAATFIICYLYAAPRQMLGRAFGLAMFVVIAAVSNEQTYSFLHVANTAMMFPTIFLIFAASAYIPWSIRPERAFLRLLGRFFRSGEYLMSTMRWDPGHSPTRLNRWRKAFHTRELATLPQKLGTWSPHIDTRALRDTSPQQIQSLVTSLQAFSYRMQELLEARGNPQAQLLVQELLADFRAWRLGVQEVFQRLSKDPAAGEREAFRNRLAEKMQHLEERIIGALDKAPDDQLSDRDEENFYRLLGAYRGVSDALVDYAGSTGVIDWARWREERFA
jgi:uncharacterized membrane protein YccC